MFAQRRIDGELRDGEEQASDAMLKARVEKALADPQLFIAQAAVFAELRTRHKTRSTT